MKKLVKITKNQIVEKGVQSLADRPNASAQYGVGGLSPSQLKIWFDKLATFLAEKINEIYDTISADDAAQYIRIALDDYGVDSLGALVEAMLNGDFANKILQVFPSANSFATVPLQRYINDAAQVISTNTEDIEDLDENKLDKVTSVGSYRRAYMIDADGTQKTIYISDAPLTGAIPVFVGEGQINVAIPTESAHASNKGYVDQQDLLLGSTVDISIDKRTYIMTLQLKNSAGKILSTSKVDFPLENVVVGGECVGGILTLRLESGESINMDVSHIVSGLVDTVTYEKDIEEIEKRIDKANEEHAAKLSVSIDSERGAVIVLENSAGEVLSEDQIEMLRSEELASLELPQEWSDINEAYEAIKEDDHKLLGGVIYKDFEGNIRVFPLSPPYGIREDEVGEEYAQSAIAMYNSKQQLLVKPATDDRHAVPLSQLIEKLGLYLAKTGGTMTGKPEIRTSNPSVKLTDTTDGNAAAYFQTYLGKAYFGYGAAKSLSVDKEGNAKVVGSFSCLAPTADGHAVNLEYFKNALKNKAPAYTYGTADIEAGSASTEPNGTLHIVYE